MMMYQTFENVALSLSRIDVNSYFGDCVKRSCQRICATEKQNQSIFVTHIVAVEGACHFVLFLCTKRLSEVEGNETKGARGREDLDGKFQVMFCLAFIFYYSIGTVDE